MFGILNETILAIYTLVTKLVRVVTALIHSSESTRTSSNYAPHVELVTQQKQENERVRQLLSYLGIEQRSRVPVKVRSDRWYFKRR